jgi:hypothetical protein
MGRDGRHDRSAFAHGPPHHLNHASSPPSPPSAAHPPSGPQSGTESTGRSPGVFPRGFLPPLPPWVQTYGMCVYIHYGFRQGAAAGRVAPGSAHAVRAPKGGCAREGARAQHQSPCALFSITLKKSSVGCCKLAKQARAVSEGVQRQPRQSRSPLVGRKCRPPLATRLPSSPFKATIFFQAQSTLLLLGLPYSYALLCRAVGGSCAGAGQQPAAPCKLSGVLQSCTTPRTRLCGCADASYQIHIPPGGGGGILENRTAIKRGFTTSVQTCKNKLVYG